MDNNAKPRYRKKGPVRFEAIVPFTIVTAAVIAYFTLFFDLHLRKGLEFGGYLANGAEVNVGRLKTSFLRGSLEIGDIQVTNALKPTHNKVQVGNVQFKFLWDALLRAKFVVELASITDIGVDTPRTTPGKVAPPASEGASMTSKLLGAAREKIQGSALGDAAKLLEGLDPTQALKDVDNLKSLAYVDTLKTDLTQKESDWSQKLEKTIPGQKDFTEQQARINSIQAGGVSNPQEVLARVNDAKAVAGEIEKKVADIKTQGDQLLGEVDGFTQSVAKIDEKIKEDREELEKRLKLPKLDARSLAEQLFGPSLFDKVAQGQHYIALARRYLPPNTGKKKPPEDKPERGQGVNYEFGRPNSYPKFWLKKAEISSKGAHSAFGGDLSGELLDVTTDPSAIGRPAVLRLAGDFPARNIQGVKLTVTVDRTGPAPTESLQAVVGSYPLAETVLSDSETLRFGMNKAQGTATVEASVQGETLTLRADNRFKNVDYLISSQSKPLQEIVTAVTQELPEISVTGKVSGPLSDLSIAIDSNLATALESGLQKQLQARLAEARAKLDALIRAKVDGKRKELTEKFNAVRGNLLSQVEERKKQAEALKAQAAGKVAELEKKTKAQAMEAADKAKGKAVESLKKKLPLGR